MKNIHLIKTDKPSRLGYLTKKGKEVFKDLRLFDRLMPNILDSENQNIYITNDEEIKEGDWCIEHDDIDKKWLNPYKPTNKSWDMVSKANYCRLRGTVKKIIVTTDQDLIKDGVQAINDEFLEWFVKNPNCEYVEVEKHWEIDNWYRIIIPKEEPK